MHLHTRFVPAILLAATLTAVPKDGNPRSVDIQGYGNYRVVSRSVQGDVIITGLPMSGVTNTVVRLGLIITALSLIGQGLWALVLTVSGRYDQLYTYVIYGMVLSYTLTVIGLFVLRWKRPDVPRPYRCTGYPWLPAPAVRSSPRGHHQIRAAPRGIGRRADQDLRLSQRPGPYARPDEQWRLLGLRGDQRPSQQLPVQLLQGDRLHAGLRGQPVRRRHVRHQRRRVVSQHRGPDFA